MARKNNQETTTEDLPIEENENELFSLDEKVKSKKSKNKKDDVPVDDASYIQDAFNMFLKKECKIEDIEEKNTPLSTGIDLFDTILGGGFYSNFNMVVGPTGCGKSSLICKVIAEGQKTWGKDFIAVYCDSEEAMTTERLASLGVTSPPLKPVNDLSVEKIFNIIRGIAVFKEKNPHTIEIPSLLVWDSIANTPTEKMYAEDEQSNVAGAQKAGAIAYHLPTIVSKLKKYNICVIAINQLRDDIQMDKYSGAVKDVKFLKAGHIPGGKSVLFNSSHLVFLTQKKDMESNYGFEAIMVEAKCLKNRRFTPKIPIEMVFGFDKGYSNYWTNFEMLSKNDYIDTGGWTKLKSCPQPSLRRKIESIKEYNSNKAWRDCFNDDVKDCLRVNFKEKYTDLNQEVELDDDDMIKID